MMLNAGTKLGRYEIRSKIGEGGMGVVYLATDTRLDRQVAIKALPEHLLSDADRLARFQREAKVLASLNHPKIGAIYGLEEANGQQYLILEFVEGETLDERLSRGPLPLEDAIEIAVHVADALESAHEKGVIHRDLKPGNIMVTPEGIVKVLDFGLARTTETTSSLSAPMDEDSPTLARPVRSPSPTIPGAIMGTAGYMSPEQVRGKPLDKRSDIFSFGCVLYEMLTGVQAFRGDTVADSIGATLHKEHDQSLLPANTPANVKRLLRRCLAKNRRDRLRDIGDARIELVVTERSDTSLSASSRIMRPIIMAAVALLAVGAVVVLAYAVAGYVAHRTEPVPILRASIELPAGEQLEVFDASIALTADGQKLAITTTDPAGNKRIWTRSLDSTKWQLMAGTDGASYPFWSPDGRNLAFFKDGKLKKLDIASGAVQTICDAPDARGGSWGSEGQILFAPEPFSALESVSSDGGTPIPMTNAPANEGISHRMPHFLPDGRHAFFVSFKGSDPGDNANGIYFLDLKTKRVRQVMSSGFEGLYVSPGYLVYARDGNLVAQPFDSGSAQVGGSPTVIAEAIVLNGSRYTGAYGLSQNGVLVTYAASHIQRSQLTWFDMDGRKLGTLGSPALYAAPPMISRDDRHVLVQIGDFSEVTTAPYWYDVVRGIGTKLPIPDHRNSALSPDDKTILYTGSSGTLKTYALDGSVAPAVVLSGSKIPYVAAWNPDGRSALYCIQQQGKMDLRFLSPASGESRSFGLVPGSSCMGTFSPDGRWLAFQSEESGQTEVYVAPLGNANDKRQVSSGGGFLPVWRGNNIYYFNGQRKLMAVDLKPSANGLEIGLAKEALGGQAFGGQLIAPGMVGTGEYLTHDGKRVLLPISVTDTSPPLNVVTNWTEALKR